MEEAGGVMNRNDMDLVAYESIYDAVGTLDYFAHCGVIDLGNNTARLRQRGQVFN